MINKLFCGFNKKELFEGCNIYNYIIHWSYHLWMWIKYYVNCILINDTDRNFISRLFSFWLTHLNNELWVKSRCYTSHFHKKELKKSQHTINGHINQLEDSNWIISRWRCKKKCLHTNRSKSISLQNKNASSARCEVLLYKFIKLYDKNYTSFEKC